MEIIVGWSTVGRQVEIEKLKGDHCMVECRRKPLNKEGKWWVTVRSRSTGRAQKRVSEGVLSKVSSIAR